MGKSRRNAGRRKRSGKTRRATRVMRGGAATLANLHAAQAAIDKAIASLGEGGAGNPTAVAVAAQAETTETTPPAQQPQAPATEAPQTGGKTKKSKRGGGMKRKLNGFMKFANTRREALMKANPGKAVSDIGKLLGGEWQALSDAAKAGFNA
jgi:hypothetical protein